MISPNLKWDSYGISKTYFYYLFITAIFSLSISGFAQPFAFPTAEGFGKNATGGRGGSVIKVTNLNDTGTGSLRNALLASGTRTIVFEVGGTINLAGNIYVTNGNFTLAGQTAPGDGILLKGGMVEVEASNVIIRYIRFRPGPSAPSGADALNITAWSGQHHEDIIIDHCSLSWASDENFDIRALPNGSVTNVTIQNSIMAECGYGSLAAERTTNLTYYRNLYANNSERNTRKGYPLAGTFDFELINNLIYGFRYATMPSMGAKFTVLNNKYKKSSQTTISSGSIVEGTSAGEGQVSETHAYINGNILAQGISQNNSALSPYLQSSPYASSGIQAIDADQLETNLLDNVGVSFPARDDVDNRLINQYINGNGALATSGTYPTIQSGTAPTDTDDDGMPDVWEIENGLNINDASDRNIVQADGYTNLEYYLNFMTLGSESFQVNAGNDVSICQGETSTLTATSADSYTWMPGNLTGDSIDVNPTTTTTYTVTGSHSNGSTSTDTITVTVNSLPIANAGQDIETCEGNSVTLTANGGTSYLWNTSETTQSITVNPNATTTYSVVVTQNGCTSELDEVIVTVNPLPNVNAGLDLTINYGESTTLTANGADSYLWNTGETTQSITVNPTVETTYTVTGTIDTCQNIDSVTVFIFGSEVVANAGEDQTICNGLQTTLTATGGAAYVWNTGETTASINVSPSNTTTYTVTAFDSTGTVSDTDDITVNVTEMPIANAGNDVEVCQGTSVTLTASGGTSYLWNTGATTQSIEVSPTSTTTYSVEVTQNNCSATDETIVTVNELPLVDAGLDVTITEGETITLTASGANTYLWNTGATTPSIEVSPTSTTTYSVTGFLNGCEATDEVIVTIETIVANAGEDVNICEGSSTTLTATGGITYQWNTGATTASIAVNPNSTTTYSVTAFNASETVSDTDDVTVTVNAIPVANAGNDVEVCQGTSVTLTASGGTSYLWNTGATTQSIEVSPTSTTTYSVEVTQNNCSATDETIVTVNELPLVDAGLDITITEGETTTLTASGADTYLWNTGATTPSIEVSPTSTTTYSVTGFLNGCEATDEVIVTVETETIIANAGVDVSICAGESTLLTASGGTTYLWNTGATTASITVNPNSTTTYSVTVFNASETVSDTDDVTVNVTQMPIANAGNDVEVCQGTSVTLAASGGTSYLWNTGATTQSIEVSPTSTTTYSVEVTQNNCSATDETIVTVNELPLVDAGLDVTITEGETTTLTASGADTYLWNTGATTPSIEVSPTSTTTYSVTGFSNGCEATDEVIVTVETETIIANAGVDVSICAGESTLLTASGGTTYLWNTGATTASITVNPNSTTTYSVTVFNASETVSDTDDVTVNVTQMPIANAGNDVEVCQGTSVTLTASGGTSYLWNTGATTQSIEVSPTSTTTYSVEVTQNNCSATDETIVTVNTLPLVDAGLDVTITEGETTTLTASGADTYLWSTGATTSSIDVSPTSTTTYSVTGFSNGCETTDEVLVTVITENVVANAGDDVSICEGTSTTLTATGGVTYQWNTGETTASISVNPNSTTTYSVTVFNASETVSDTDDVTVTVNPIPVANAGNDVEVCQGSSVTLTASGGTSYLWNTGATTQSITVNPNTTTTFSVEVTQNNCSATDETIVTVNTLPLVDAGIDVTITEGETTTLTASEADTYLWSTGATTSSIDVSPTSTTTYSVTGFSNGCEATDEVLVIVEPFVYTAYAGEDQSICEGTSTILTASEGDAYLWSTGETTQSITVNPWASETYTVTVFEEDEQAQDDVTVFVNLNPNVVIMNGGEVTILEGEFITLSASGANTYEWDNGATLPNIAVSPTLSRTYSVTGYINNCSDEKSVTVNVVETVEAYAGEDLTICSNEIVTLTANAGNSEGEEYLWNTGETTQSIEVAPGTDTEYSVLVYNALSSDEATVMVYVNDCSPVVIPVEEEFNVLIYQDVSADVLKVQISGLDRVDVDQIMIYDITGKSIYKEQIRTDENMQSLDKEIDSSQFSRGIYIVRLIYDDTEIVKKIPIR